MPWKYCPRCKNISYSAATRYESWPCPHCKADLKTEPEYDVHEAKALKERETAKTLHSEKKPPGTSLVS